MSLAIYEQLSLADVIIDINNKQAFTSQKETE